MYVAYVYIEPKTKDIFVVFRSFSTIHFFFFDFVVSIQCLVDFIVSCAERMRVSRHWCTANIEMRVSSHVFWAIIVWSSRQGKNISCIGICVSECVMHVRLCMRMSICTFTVLNIWTKQSTIQKLLEALTPTPTNPLNRNLTVSLVHDDAYTHIHFHFINTFIWLVIVPGSLQCLIPYKMVHFITIRFEYFPFSFSLHSAFDSLNLSLCSFHSAQK